MGPARDTVDYFAYGAELEVATWGVPMDVALLRYHRLVLAQPVRGDEPELTLVPDPEGEVPGLMFRLSYADLARAMGLVVRTWPRHLQRVVVCAPGDRVLSVKTNVIWASVPPATVSREVAAELRALYRRHGVNPFALEAALVPRCQPNLRGCAAMTPTNKSMGALQADLGDAWRALAEAGFALANGVKEGLVGDPMKAVEAGLGDAAVRYATARQSLLDAMRPPPPRRTRRR